MEGSDISKFLLFGRTQKLLFVLCGGGWAIAMGVVASIAVLINELHKDWGLSFSVLSILPMFNMFGIFLGSNVWGMISDRYGRMYAFKPALLICTAALALSVFSVNFYMLAAIFPFIGFGLAGSLSVDGAVFLEYCPKDKAYLLTGMSVVCAFGGMYATGSAWLLSALSVPSLWRYVLGINSILCLCISIPRFWVSETPMFLASRGRFNEAAGVIRLINSESVDENALKTVNFNENQGSVLKLTEQVKVLFRPPLKRLMVLYLLVRTM